MVKKIPRLLHSKITALLSRQESGKKPFSALGRLRFSKKAKCLIAVAIIAVFIVSIFAFLPNQPAKGIDTPLATDGPTSSPSPTSTPASTSNTGSNLIPITRVGTGVVTYIPPKGPGLIESASVIDKGVWMSVARYAWNSFQIKAGVDEGTGLPYAGGQLGFRCLHTIHYLRPKYGFSGH